MLSFEEVINDCTLEQDLARWFAGAHKELFGNGPQVVNAVVIDSYCVIAANKVLNKFEKSLTNIPEGPYRIQYTRNLLFEEVKEEFKVSFYQVFKLKVKDIRYSLNVEKDKSLFIVVT